VLFTFRKLFVINVCWCKILKIKVTAASKEFAAGPKALFVLAPAGASELAPFPIHAFRRLSSISVSSWCRQQARLASLSRGGLFDFARGKLRSPYTNPSHLRLDSGFKIQSGEGKAVLILSVDVADGGVGLLQLRLT
jgi:hypothetical protein